jgi:hypothetical protein
MTMDDDGLARFLRRSPHPGPNMDKTPGAEYGKDPTVQISPAMLWARSDLLV